MVRFPFYCCLLSSRRRGQIKNQILPLIFIHLDLKKIPRNKCNEQRDWIINGMWFLKNVIRHRGVWGSHLIVVVVIPRTSFGRAQHRPASASPLEPFSSLLSSFSRCPTRRRKVIITCRASCKGEVLDMKGGAEGSHGRRNPCHECHEDQLFSHVEAHERAWRFEFCGIFGGFGGWELILELNDGFRGCHCPIVDREFLVIRLGFRSRSLFICIYIILIKMK